LPVVALAADGRVRPSLAALRFCLQHAVWILTFRLSPGGYAIIDDYGEIESCHKAVDDFRQKENTQSRLSPIDADGVFWKKTLNTI